MHLPWAEWGLTETLILQVADLGHLWSPLPLHRSWVGLLEEEMFQMGDREKQMVISLFWQLCWHRALQALDEHGTSSSQLSPKMHLLACGTACCSASACCAQAQHPEQSLLPGRPPSD